jgi:hypothetical protein
MEADVLGSPHGLSLLPPCSDRSDVVAFDTPIGTRSHPALVFALLAAAFMTLRAAAGQGADTGSAQPAGADGNHPSSPEEIRSAEIGVTHENFRLTPSVRTGREGLYLTAANAISETTPQSTFVQSRWMLRLPRERLDRAPLGPDEKYTPLSGASCRQEETPSGNAVFPFEAAVADADASGGSGETPTLNLPAVRSVIDVRTILRPGSEGGSGILALAAKVRDAARLLRLAGGSTSDPTFRGEAITLEVATAIDVLTTQSALRSCSACREGNPILRGRSVVTVAFIEEAMNFGAIVLGSRMKAAGNPRWRWLMRSLDAVHFTAGISNTLTSMR